MNKLAFALATVAALSLSTAAFAQTSTPASTPRAVQSAPSQAQVTKHVKKRHHAATNKVAASRHDRSLNRHHGSKNKKVVTKHTPAKSVKTKAAS